YLKQQIVLRYDDRSLRDIPPHEFSFRAIPAGALGGRQEWHGASCWRITAGEGPSFSRQRVDGIDRHCFGYVARGVPYGPHDGTFAPWAVACVAIFCARNRAAFAAPCDAYVSRDHKGISERLVEVG
ncbi:MAG: glucoamylase family protein, partial [Acidobacteriota bacterium]